MCIRDRLLINCTKCVLWVNENVKIRNLKIRTSKIFEYSVKRLHVAHESLSLVCVVKAMLDPPTSAPFISIDNDLYYRPLLSRDPADFSSSIHSVLARLGTTTIWPIHCPSLTRGHVRQEVTSSCDRGLHTSHDGGNGNNV